MKKLLVFAVAILGFSAFSFGQNSATQTANALVVKTITITSGTNLDFGTFASRNLQASTVVLGLDGSRTASTANTLGNDGVAGTFTITGDPAHLVTVGFPAGVTNLTGAGAPMTINSADWQTDGGSLGSFTILTGTRTLTVGATLQVGANQTAGSYSGTYTVTANYN